MAVDENIDPKKRELILKCLEQGVKQVDIAKRCKVSLRTVSRVKKDNANSGDSSK